MLTMNDRIIKLQNDINDSAQMISCQINGIESNLLGAFISIIASAFVSNAFGILKFWTPVSFILMWIILFSSFIMNIFPDKPIKAAFSDEAQTVMDSKLPSPKIDDIALIKKLKNAVPFVNSVGVIFFISLLSLFAYRLGIIKLEITTSTNVPIISCLLFISLPLIIHWEIDKLDKISFKSNFNKLGCFVRFLLLILGLVSAFSFFVFPIWSLNILHSNYPLTINTLLSVLVVISLQTFTALIFINYFSANLAKKELMIALFNLSHIRNRIHDLGPYQPVSELTYKDLVKSYAKAKRYEICADDSLFVTFYSIAPNQTYIAELLNEEEKKTDSPT